MLDTTHTEQLLVAESQTIIHSKSQLALYIGILSDSQQGQYMLPSW